MANDETTQSAVTGPGAQSAGDGRSVARGERRDAPSAAGTSGEDCGTSGSPIIFLRSWLIVLAVTVVVVAVNSLTVTDDNPGLDWWEPWVWEGSSALVIAAILWIPWLAYLRAPPQAGMLSPWFWATHALGLLGFSAAHVGGFLALRHLAYAIAGQTYQFGSLVTEFPYELRKDLLSYALFMATFWSVEQFGALRRATPAGPSTFDILDGQRVIRVPLDQIVAITSAGNYVEFLLEDGRKPLMRAPLTAVEGDLGERGFVRTHRSWLVNRTRVTGLKPEGSGDWSVELGAVEVPLSRRFKAALEQLKDG